VLKLSIFQRKADEAVEGILAEDVNEAVDGVSENWSEIFSRARSLASKYHGRAWHVYRDMALASGAHPVKSTAFLLGTDDVTVKTDLTNGSLLMGGFLWKFAGKSLKVDEVMWLHWNQLLDSEVADEDCLSRGALVFIGSPHAAKQNEAKAWLDQCFKRFPSSALCRVCL
jgi:hypothetical protein